jgi:FkbM family methyltransferase
MLSPRIANRLTLPVTMISQHLPDFWTKVIVHLHRPLIGHQILCLDHDGFKIFVDPNDNCGGRLYYWGSYEPEQTAAFKALLHELHPATFIDIGANIGYYSLLAATHSRAKVYSFEPSPSIADCLTRSVNANLYNDRIRVIRKAASCTPGELSFFINENPHNFGLGSIVNTVASSTMVNVECCAADDELQEDLAAPILCKIDVEGAELMVLKGMTRILENLCPVLIVEMHPVELVKAGASARQVYDLLGEAGYSLRMLESEDEITSVEALPTDTNYWFMGSPSKKGN